MKQNQRSFYFNNSKDSYLSLLSQFTARASESADDLSTSAKAARHAIHYLSLPAPQHTYAVQEILIDAGGEKLAGDASARQILERELIKECKEFEASCALDKTLFAPSGRLYLDELFSHHIARIGAHGKKLSEELRTASTAWSQTFWNERSPVHLFKLWSDPEMSPYYCRYLKLLAEILWKDRAVAQFEKSQKHVLAITQSVHRPLARTLSSLSSVLMDQGRPMILYEGKVVAQTAAIDPKLLKLVEKGARLLSSVYHHRLLRYECKKGFENWIQGKEEPRILRINGGETELAELLGFKFKEAPSILKALLHAQAHMEFIFDDGRKASLVGLGKYRSLSTNREDGLEIVLSEQLMPYYTFQTTRQGKLLVPLPEFPSFVSAPQYQAGQSLLQMLILEEFTNRSIELSREGSIEIAPDRWADFFRQSALPRSVFKQALASWTQSEGRFLIQIAPNRYVLGEACRKEYQFLQAQGELRKERQRQGRISVRKRTASLSNTCSSPSSRP
jgi:hypothetical protein